MKSLRTILPALLAVLLSHCATPIAKFSSPEEVPAFTYVTLENESTKATSYEWDFGDGNTSTDAMPKHRYTAPGVYQIQLTAMNEQGKQKTISQEVEITAPHKCLIKIETSAGTMIAELYDVTPQHQDNFVKLVEQSFYDDLLFHRVIQSFMIQGGDPSSKGAAPNRQLGTGGPGYTVPAEFADSLAHVKGAIGAARSPNPQKASNGSQFYIVHGRTVTDAELNQQEARGNFRYPSYVRKQYLEIGGFPSLDQEYTVFGRVIEGLEVIDAIAGMSTNAQNRPKTDVWMKISLIR